MTDTTTPEPTDPDGIEGTSTVDYAPDGQPLTINIQVTQTDPELQAIESILVILQMVQPATQERILRYLRDRIEGDPTAWDTHILAGPEQVSRREVARVLAESDGRDWEKMTDAHQSPYYRRAEDITRHGFVVVRAER